METGFTTAVEDRATIVSALVTDGNAGFTGFLGAGINVCDQGNVFSKNGVDCIGWRCKQLSFMVDMTATAVYLNPELIYITVIKPKAEVLEVNIRVGLCKLVIPPASRIEGVTKFTSLNP
jgi:hypothetical protein